MTARALEGHIAFLDKAVDLRGPERHLFDEGRDIRTIDKIGLLAFAKKHGVRIS